MFGDDRLRHLSANIRDEDYEYIAELADAWEMSVSQMVRKILKEFCEKHRKGEWTLDES